MIGEFIHVAQIITARHIAEAEVDDDLLVVLPQHIEHLFAHRPQGQDGVRLPIEPGQEPGHIRRYELVWRRRAQDRKRLTVHQNLTTGNRNNGRLCRGRRYRRLYGNGRLGLCRQGRDSRLRRGRGRPGRPGLTQNIVGGPSGDVPTVIRALVTVRVERHDKIRNAQLCALPGDGLKPPGLAVFAGLGPLGADLRHDERLDHAGLRGRLLDLARDTLQGLEDGVETDDVRLRPKGVIKVFLMRGHDRHDRDRAAEGLVEPTNIRIENGREEVLQRLARPLRIKRHAVLAVIHLVADLNDDCDLRPHRRLQAAHVGHGIACLKAHALGPRRQRMAIDGRHSVKGVIVDRYADDQDLDLAGSGQCFHVCVLSRSNI